MRFYGALTLAVAYIANKLRHMFVKIEVAINSDTQKLHWMTDFNTFAIMIKQKITRVLSQPHGATFITIETHGVGLKSLGGWNKISMHSLLNLNGIETSFKKLYVISIWTNIRMKGSIHNVIHESIKNKGPSTDPWGMLLTTLNQSEKVSPILTLWNLLER